MSADPSSAGTGTTAPTPVSTRAAFAVLGSMIFLILALTIVLVRSTWGHPANTAEAAPVLHHSSLGGR